MQPSFLYFDFGKVLVDFSIEQMLRQMADVAHIEPARAREIVFGGRLQAQYEAGQISSQEFYEAFCRSAGTRPDYAELARAASDIFELNLSMVPVVAQLRHAGYRLGILSNTCENHWEHCRARFRLLDDTFAVHVLSYQVGACKPDAAIFQAAAEMAGCPPRNLFFTDDIAGHVAGAQAVGIDAVQYTTTPQLVAELRQRGIRFNY